MKDSDDDCLEVIYWKFNCFVISAYLPPLALNNKITTKKQIKNKQKKTQKTIKKQKNK